MQKLDLDLAALRVESFRTVEATPIPSPAYPAETLRACPTQPWTCTYTG